jgi:hypothetical protein
MGWACSYDTLTVRQVLKRMKNTYIHIQYVRYLLSDAFIIFFHASTALVGLCLLIVEVSRSHSFRHTTLGRTPLDE